MHNSRKSVLFAGAALMGLVLASGAWAQVKSFNVAPAEAVKTIPEFASQAGIQIIAPAGQLKGIRTQAVRGNLDTRAALAQLLEGTNLEIASDNGSVISLRVKNTAPAAITPMADEAVETVVVTGSRLASRGFKAPTPVSVHDAQEFKLSGTQNVEQLLNDSPQFAGNQLNSPTANTVQAGQPIGTATLNMRNFGATRNLVLVNGRRFAITGPDFTADINTIPAALIKRTEVVTGGSSAVYGSDAITGVVNFVMKDDFEGVEANYQRSWDQPTGTPTHSLDLTAGGNFADGRGNIVVSLNYLSREGYTRGERGDWAGLSLTDGCVTAASYNKKGPGTPLAVPSGQTCAEAGGRQGLIYSGSSNVPNGRIANFPVVGSSGSNPALDAALIAAGLGGMTSQGAIFSEDGRSIRPYDPNADSFDLSPDSYMVTPQTRWMGNVFSHYDFTDKVTGYMELHYSSNRTDVQIAPTNIGGNLLVDVDNPYVSAEMREVFNQLDLRETGTTTVTQGTSTMTTTAGDGLAVINLNRRLSDMGPRFATSDHNVFRAAFGFRGNLGDVSPNLLRNLNYDIYYSYARTSEAATQLNSLSRSRFQRSMLSVGGADPVLNPFGQNLTEASINAISITSNSSMYAEQQVFAGNLTGEAFDMPAGPVDFSTGFEWRYAYAKYTPDSYLASGDVSGWNGARATSGSSTVKEIYGEVRVPILADVPFARRLSLNGAFRYSDYELPGVGGVWTHSLGAEWAINTDLTLRAQTQHAIRAPNVGELYGGQGTDGPTANDPCSSRAPVSQQTQAVRDLCIATGVPADRVFDVSVQPGIYMTQVIGGNPNLSPEESDTVTVGLVWTPQFLRGFGLSLDYFKIELDDAISTLGGGGLQNVLNLCYYTIQSASSVYCQAINRDSQTGEVAAPNYVTTTMANIGGIKTSGIDLEARYGFRTDWGLMGDSRWDISSQWTYTEEFTLTPIQEMPDVTNECLGAFGGTCGQPTPRWKGSTRVTWRTGPLTLSARARYIGQLTADAHLVPLRRGETPRALESMTHPVISPRTYIDLSSSYELSNSVTLSGGIRNLLDKDPPILGSLQQSSHNTIPATYDVQGRVFFVGANMRF